MRRIMKTGAAAHALALAAVQALAAAPAGMAAGAACGYALKDGALHKDGSPLEGEILDLEGLSGRDVRIAVAEVGGGAEAAVLGKEGKCLAAVPLDGPSALHDASLSPDGKYLALEAGSSVRMDVFLEVWSLEGGGRLAEIPSWRGAGAWIGPGRLALTRLDGQREGALLNSPEGAALSVCVLDAASKRLEALRESTPAESFLLESAEGGKLRILKLSASSPGDWAGEGGGEIKAETIEVDAPAPPEGSAP
jgi:hypothetical protein